MRPSRNSRHLKKNSRHKVYKKKRTNRASRSRGHNRNIPLANIEDVNEIVREHVSNCDFESYLVKKTPRQRSQRAAGMGSWKVVPKDSCEVYKDRKRKETESENREQDEKETPAEENDTQQEREGRDSKKLRKKQDDTRPKKRKVKKSDKKYKNRKRRHRCSSCTSSCSGTSVSSCCTAHS